MPLLNGYMDQDIWLSLPALASVRNLVSLILEGLMVYGLGEIKDFPPDL